MGNNSLFYCIKSCVVYYFANMVGIEMKSINIEPRLVNFMLAF
jgi:hypothetical protein